MPEPTFDSAPNDRPPPVHDAPLRPSRSPWDGGSDRSHVKTFVLAASLMALIGLGVLATRADVKALWRKHFGPPLSTAELKEQARSLIYWGQVPVHVVIGGTQFSTALFPRGACYLVPLKAAVRKAEGLDEGDVVAVRLRPARRSYADR